MKRAGIAGIEIRAEQCNILFKCASPVCPAYLSCSSIYHLEAAEKKTLTGRQICPLFMRRQTGEAIDHRPSDPK